MIRQFALLASVFIVSLGNVVCADDPVTSSSAGSGWKTLPLSNETGSSPEVLYNRSTQAQRLRQQRALYQEQQRLARIEANLWMGYEPLRPSWPASPSMTSRYRTNRVVVIPYFVP